MKTLKSFFVLFAGICALSLASCGDDDPEPSPNPGNPSEPTTPTTPSENEAITPAKQKEYIETVAIDFMNETPSSDFKELVNLGTYISDVYVDEYDWDEVGDWAKGILDAAQKSLGTTTKKTETNTWGDYTYNDIYVYQNYTSLLYASNFTGHFTAKNGKWTYAKANDLQFVFDDANGKQCVLKLETSGNVKKVHAMNLDEWKDYESDDNGYVYTSTEYYDRTQYTIGVPENIAVILTQGGSQTAKVSVKLDLGSIDNEEFDISKNSLNLSTLVELNNGYKMNVSQVAYNANNKVSVQFAMTKNSKTLVTAAIASDISGIPSCNVSAFTSENFDIDDYNTDNANAKNAYVKLDILGKIQIQGTLADVRKFADYLEKADDNDTNESSFKSYINQANSLADINLFYDGKSAKQASVKFEPFVDETWDGKTWWTAEPVLHFYDGSSYSTFEAFFNDADFKKTIDVFKDLVDSYSNLFDR